VAIAPRKPRHVPVSPRNQRRGRRASKIVSGACPILLAQAAVTAAPPRRRLEQYNLSGVGGNLLLTDPFGYLEFLWLQQHASVVVTDSGGIQEETTYLQIPCLTMRENTERPVTVEIGTNILVGGDTARLGREVESILDGRAKKGAIPPLWDGKSGMRIARILDGLLQLQ